jgi:PAS domain S-box-containing protein
LRIYSRKGGISAVPQLDLGSYEDAGPAGVAKKTVGATTAVDVQRRVDQYILSRYSPAGVLVDEELNVLQFHGHTSPYLEHASGEPALNMNRMLRGELAIEFRKLFDRARKKQTAIKGEPIRVSHLDRVHNVRVSVTPMVLPGSVETQYLTLFEEFPVAGESKKIREPEATETKAGSLARRIHDLEDELASTKQYLESVIEEQQATTEELKSANEEVQSSNEELQSTNEELLTSKEELQSANEELTTVNEELHNRNGELSQFNNDLNNLLSSVNIPIVMLGNDLRIRRFTPQAEKVLNLLPTDIGRPISDFKPKIDIPDLEQWFAEVIESLRVKEREVQGRDGRWYSIWIRPYRTAENKIDGAVMALLDITERKVAAEARYRRLFEAAKDAIIIADAETGEIIDLNPYTSRTFGISRTASIGLKFWDLEMFRDSGLDSRTLKELHDDETIQKDMAVVTKTGKRIEIELIGNLYLEAEKRVIQFNMRDISERKTLEENARRTLEQVQQAQKLEAIGRLAGGVAHDFNNLLTAVMGHADLLKQRLSPDHSAFGDAEQISRAAERAGRLTRQLLAFGRRQPSEPEILSLNNLISEMEQMVRVTLPSSIELRIESSPDLKPVKVDRGQIEQVILNLAMNARDAMPSGGILTIATRNSTIDAEYSREHPAVPPGDYVRLEVADTGSGMDPETKSHLFEPYFTTKPRGKGAGLGLSMIYGAVRNAGGHIWAASELGRGSTFCIFLPEVNAQVTVSEDHEGEHGLRSGQETILLVEDDEMVRSLTARILRQCGYKVLEAPGGPEAMAIARSFREPIHLLLTDVEMPHMNGRELAAGITALMPDTRIMFMSGHTEDDVIHHGVSENEWVFLQKPFTPETLSKEIRGILESR